MTEKFDPVRISLVRNAMPNIIASDICSAQPMFSPHDQEEWPYQVDVLGHIKYHDIPVVKEWCKNTLTDSEWIASVQFFGFKTKEAYSWFKLRWL